ncbi:MAG: 3'(2'),5'-bisphosphate nucleotidase CysQ [Saprospiraceae bacterium]|nr:3'(2'),5'-bisphosphate nucleotidase CysQ [Saprospiraceae bacterium]
MIETVKEIARAAGAVILDVYNQPGAFQVNLKSDDSPLTIADKKANGVICDGLEKLASHIPIISEENKEIPFEERKHFTQHWLVDPLDGTKEFIKRNGEFTVNIALIENQRVILGVVYAPVLDELYWAEKDQGAFLEKDGQVKQLQAPKFEWTDPKLKVVCSRSHLNDDTRAFIEKLNQAETVATGSSLKFLIMAKGEAHVYPRLGPTMEWDTGAAQIILEEAGGMVVQHETNQPMNYNKENLLNPFFIAFGNAPLSL